MLVAAEALRDVEGCSSTLKKEQAVGHPLCSVGLGQVSGSFPWPGGMEVDAFGNVP